ncbi:MAG: P1 family peptidase [Acidimicrobiia bacterium]|nr:P1 family peptidase [Acidimicrobiia bacterium]
MKTTIALALAASVALAASPAAQSRSAVRSKGLTEVEGLRVGHHTLSGRPTGCTVVLVDGTGAPGGVAQRGAAPGTRETDLLDPLNMVDKVNAIVLAGGSAYGLDAAQGVVKYLEERKIGWDVGTAGVVPIVPSAILIDLWFGGDPKIRPTADCGYRAAEAATDGPVAEGNVGAGAGATLGKVAGRERSMKGGTGTAAIRLPNGLVVSAIVAVNAIGDVIDPSTGQVIAGVRTPDGRQLADARRLLREGALLRAAAPRAVENTTIAIVATNARMNKTEVNRVALMADDGLARAISPAHTIGDGDTVFALATGRWDGQADASIVGALAAEVLADAIVRAVTQTESLGGLPSARELGTVPARLR